MAVRKRADDTFEADIQSALDKFKETKDIRSFQIDMAELGLYPKDQIDGIWGKITDAAENFALRTNDAKWYVINRLDDYESLPAREVIIFKMALNRLGHDLGDPNSKIDGDLKRGINEFSLTSSYDSFKNHVSLISPISLIGDEIKVDPSYLDAAFQGWYSSLVEQGKISPLSADKKAELRESLLGEFKNQSLSFPSQTPGVSTAPTNAPHFLMITPHEVGGGFAARLEDHKKWYATKAALEAAGAKITVIDGKHAAGGYKETWTRDRMLVIGDAVFMSDKSVHKDIVNHDDYTDAKDSQQQLRDVMTERGYKVVDVKDSWFEGGNIILHDASGTLFMGMEDWATPESAKKLIESIKEHTDQNLKAQLVPLTENPPFYHLDVMMSPVLPNGEIIFYPGATDPDTAAKIIETFGEENVIQIDRETAEKYVTNVNFVGNTIVMTDSTPALEEELRNRGYKLITPEDYGLDSFEFGTGGVHCFTNEILPQDPVHRNTAPTP